MGHSPAASRRRTIKLTRPAVNATSLQESAVSLEKPTSRRVGCSAWFGLANDGVLPVLDPRPPPEWEQKHPSGAISLPAVAGSHFHCPAVRERPAVVDAQPTLVAQPKREAV